MKDIQPKLDALSKFVDELFTKEDEVQGVFIGIEQNNNQDMKVSVHSKNMNCCFADILVEKELKQAQLLCGHYKARRKNIN